jgi:long-chain acyl-CoA synthetase
MRVADNGEVLVEVAGLLKELLQATRQRTAEVLTCRRLVPHRRCRLHRRARATCKIIDRAKDVGHMRVAPMTARMFAPKYVENKLKFFPHIKEAVAYRRRAREGRAPLINIDLDAVGNWAERRNLPYAGYTDLAQKPEVYELISECVEKVNADLAHDALLAGCQVSRFLMLHKELDADDGELTRTQQGAAWLHRRKIRACWSTRLYGGAASQFIETQVKFEDGRNGQRQRHAAHRRTPTTFAAR